MSPPTDDEAMPPPGTTAPLVNAEHAIALMDGSIDLYVEITNVFLEELRGLPQDLQRSLQQADLADAIRQLHTFKGLSLTVGAEQLSAVLKHWELALKTRTQSAHPLTEAQRLGLLDSVSQAASQARQALLQVLAEKGQSLPAPAEAPAPSAPADVLKDLNALHALLTGSDMQALDHHAALKARHPELGGRLQDLDRAMLAFDFDQAVVQCKALIDNFTRQ